MLGVVAGNAGNAAVWPENDFVRGSRNVGGTNHFPGFETNNGDFVLINDRNQEVVAIGRRRSPMTDAGQFYPARRSPRADSKPRGPQGQRNLAALQAARQTPLLDLVARRFAFGARAKVPQVIKSIYAG